MLRIHIFEMVVGTFKRGNGTTLNIEPSGELLFVCFVELFVSLLLATALDLGITGRIIVILAIDVNTVVDGTPIYKVDSLLVISRELRPLRSTGGTLNASLCPRT
jgi:hypothetical protein